MLFPFVLALLALTMKAVASDHVLSFKNIISRPEYVGKLLILFFSLKKGDDSIELFVLRR